MVGDDGDGNPSIQCVFTFLYVNNSNNNNNIKLHTHSSVLFWSGAVYIFMLLRHIVENRSGVINSPFFSVHHQYAHSPVYYILYCTPHIYVYSPWMDRLVYFIILFPFCVNLFYKCISRSIFRSLSLSFGS